MSDIILRQCTKCKQFKPRTPEFFHVCNSKPSGFASHCKVCRNDTSRKPINPEKIVPEGQKRCTKCKQCLPATSDYFHAHRQQKDGLRSMCKVCRSQEEQPYTELDKLKTKEYNRIHAEERSAKSKLYYQEHKERYRLWSQQYLQTHKEEARAIGRNRQARKKAAKGSHTAKDIQAQLKRQKGKCYYCQEKLGKGKRAYHVDHVIPLFRGGSNDISNLVVTCPFCNQSKGYKLPHEWAQGGRLM